MTTTLEIDKAKAVKEIKDWIDHILRRKGWTGTDLARKADLAPSTILRMYSDKNYTFVSSYSTIMKIANASGYKPPPSLLEAFNIKDQGFDTGMTAPVHVSELEKVAVGENVRPVPLHRRTLGKLGNRNGLRDTADNDSEDRSTAGSRTIKVVPIKFVSSLPKTLQPLSQTRKEVECPTRLAGDTTAFAFHMPDNSMTPWIPVKSMMFATKSRDPIRGDVVMITKTDGRTIVRAVDDINEDGITVSKGGADGSAMKVPFDSIEDIGVVTIMERS